MIKKFIVALALLFSVSAFAQVSVTGGVGADSNFIFRGETLSDKNPSVNGGVGVSAKFDGLSVFGGLDGHSTSFAGSSAAKDVRALAIGEAGVGFEAKDVGAIQTGVRQYWWFGGSNAGLKPTDLNFREWFVRGQTGVLGGVAAAEYDRTVSNQTGATGHDAYWKVGYVHSVFVPQLSVGVAASWKQYDAANVTRYNNTELTAAYAVTKNLSVYALESLGGKDVANTKIGNQFAAGVKYMF